MSTLQALWQSMGGFVLVVSRVGGIFLAAPVYSNNLLPTKLKAAMILVCSLVAFPALSGQGLLPRVESGMDLLLLGVGEFAIGGIIGFMALLVLTIFQVSGQFYSLQMGFGIINVLDPMADASIPIISQFKTMIITLVFLLIEGHHFLLRAVFRSYRLLPTLYETDLRGLALTVASKFDQMFYLGFLVGMPLIGVVFLVSLSLGLLSKLAPQLNVLMVGFGLKILVGLLTFLGLVPLFVPVAAHLFNRAWVDLLQLLEAL